MAIATPTKISVSIKLNDGVKEDGTVKTVSQNMGTLSTTGYDDDKMLTVISSLTPCLTKSLVSVQRTNTYTITASA